MLPIAHRRQILVRNYPISLSFPRKWKSRVSETGLYALKVFTTVPIAWISGSVYDSHAGKYQAGKKMTINSISAAGLSQSVLLSNNSTQMQQALQILQNSLSSKDLNSAQSAFQTVQNLYQNSTITSAGSTPGSSQLSTDLAALGTALSSGNLSTAQTALTTLQGDLNKGPSPSLTDEANAASQSTQMVDELLSTVNVSNSSSGNSDLTNSVLEQV